MRDDTVTFPDRSGSNEAIMTGQHDRTEPDSAFLSVEDAEIVHGPDVIASKVTGALKDADRFDLPNVKPPLSEALDEVERAGASGETPASEPVEQNALAGKAADIDDSAGSAELLKPDEAPRRP